MEEVILHLYMLNYCGHKCKLCCNKKYDIEKLPVVTEEQLKSCTTLCLTGGDPFYITSYKLEAFVLDLRLKYPNIQNVYVYTSGAALWEIDAFEHINFNIFDAVNIAPKNNNDWSRTFEVLERQAYPKSKNNKNRLYVFKDQMVYYQALIECLKVYPYLKKQFEENFEVLFRTWDEEFKTPDNEYFVRLEKLYEAEQRPRLHA